MANYRQIHTKIWRDNWFLELDSDEKLLFIYLFSNDNTNLAGIYELNERIIQLETGLDKTRIREILNKFEVNNKVYFQDGIVWIVNMRKYHTSTGEKVRRGIEISLDSIPDCEIKQKYLISNGIELENTLSEKTNTLSYNKSKSKSENKSKSKSESNAPDGATFTSSHSEKILSITEQIKKAGVQITPEAEQAIKTLAVAFKTPDILDAIDHMAAHTTRPNLGYLKKVLDGWFAERKIEKVYS